MYSLKGAVLFGFLSFFAAGVILRSLDLVIQRIQASYHNCLPPPEVKKCRSCETCMTVVRVKSGNSIRITSLNQYRERFTNEPYNGVKMAKKSTVTMAVLLLFKMLVHPMMAG